MSNVIHLMRPKGSRNSIDVVASSKSIDDDMKDKFYKKQQNISRFRQVMGHLAEVDTISSTAEMPLSRNSRKQNKF